MMNSYRITHKIRTLAKLPDSMSELAYSGFTFKDEQCSDIEGVDGGWIVEKVVEGSGWQQAYGSFLRALDPVVIRLSFVTQTAFYLPDNSFLLHKENDNPRHLAVVRVSRTEKGNGLFLDEEYQPDLDKLVSVDNDIAFYYLAESTRATTLVTRLSMLFSAVEALADSKTTFPKCNKGHQELVCTSCGESAQKYPAADKQSLKDICGSDLYEKIWGKGGLRNRIFHGQPFTIQLDGSQKNGGTVAEDLFLRIVSYLNARYQTRLPIDTEHPQRNYYSLQWRSTLAWRIVNLALLNDFPLLIQRRLEYKSPVLRNVGIPLPHIFSEYDMEMCKLPEGY